MLENAGAKEGSKISVRSKGRTYNGILMPHLVFSGKDVVVIKLSSGYNIGVEMNGDSAVEITGQPEPAPVKERVYAEKEGLPRITILGTGGTIVSRADSRTGAADPSLPITELIDSVPELREEANISAKALFSILSEDIGADHWRELAESVAGEMNKGADAVMILHGTDTMGYTAAALSFMLGDVPKPVVLVGAQRSPDRPSSDAPSNILAALRFCTKGKAAGVFIVMHNTLEDDSFAVHVGTRARKMHTSRRDTFRSINAEPFAVLDETGKMEFSAPGRAVSSEKATARTKMERSVILLQFYPGMDPSLFEDAVMKSKGIVISGTGLGHTNKGMTSLIKKACGNGSVVVMTSQCLGGSTNLNVYSTGREIRTAGAISVKDMLPETAYVKLMWVLANTGSAEEAKELMLTPLSGEMGNRRVF